MIIVRVDSGLCNQMYFFATAYALAREWEEELIIDPGMDGNADWTYLLDEFQLPLYKKIIYPMRYQVGNGFDKRPAEMKEKAVVIDETYFEQKGEYITIPKEKFVSQFPGKDIYLKGTFLTRQMFTKYLPDLRKIFTLKKPSSFVQEFEKRIVNVTAVGVHVRRQGFTLLGDNNGMDYFRASIVYMRKKYQNTRFYIFSDEPDYVKENLGTADDIFYVEAMNGYYGDIEEFICLTKCHHYILTRRSSYGRMAEILNSSETKTSVLFGSNTWNDSEERFYFMPQEEVDKLSKLFEKQEIICQTKQDCPRDMQQLIDIGLDSENVQMEDRRAFIFQRAKIYAEERMYGDAVHLCRLLEDQYAENSDEFHGFFGNLLCRYGAIRESLVEYKRLWKKKLSEEKSRKHYIIVPYKGYDSQYLSELQMLGLILGRLGNDVSFVFKRFKFEISEGDVNAAMMSWSNNINNKWMDMILEKGFSICRYYYGYPCYEYASVLENKDDNLQAIAEKYPEEETIVVGRDPQMLTEDVPFKKIFVDFSVPFDEAYIREEVGGSKIGQMYQCADIVVTGDCHYSKNGQKVLRIDDSLLDKAHWNEEIVVPYYEPTIYTNDYLDIALKIDAECS